MPHLMDNDPRLDQENLDPFDDDDDDDRAEVLAQKIRQERIEESANDRMGEHGTGNPFDHDRTLDDATLSDHHLPSIPVASVQIASQLTSFAPLDSNQEPAQTSANSTPAQEDESVDDSDEPIVVKTSKKYQWSRQETKKRKASAVDKPSHKGRELRMRTSAQETPFKADKVAYSMTKSRGRNPSKAEVEKQLEKEKEGKQTKPTYKPRKRSKSIETLPSDNSSTASSSAEPEAVSDEYKRQHTTLRITIADSSDGGMEVPLAQFADLTDLIDFIDERWGRVKHGRVDHLTCERPWKNSDSSLAIYGGWDDQYKVLADSVLEAPVWRKKNTLSCTLEVKIVVTLEAAP